MTNHYKSEVSSVSAPPKVPDALLTPSLFKTLFMKPRFLVHSPVTAHLPFLFWLSGVLKPRRVAVLGCNDGAAHFAFCQSLDGAEAQCLGFGFWPNGKSGKPYGGAVSDKLRKHGEMLYDGVSQLFSVISLNDALDRIRAERVDLLFADLTALPSDMLPSAETLMGCLSAHGVLVLHGTNEGSGAVDRRALTHFLEGVDHVAFPAEKGLVVVTADEDQPSALRLLIESAPHGELRGDVDLVFRRSGAGILSAAKASALAITLDQAEKSAAATQANLEEAQYAVNALKMSHEARSISLIEAQTENFDLLQDRETLARSNADALSTQLTAAETERAELEVARDTAIAEAERVRATLIEQADALSTQLSASETERAELEVARDTAIAKAERERATFTEQADALSTQLTAAATERAELEVARDTAIAEAERVRATLIEQADALSTQLTAAETERAELEVARDTAIAEAERVRATLIEQADALSTQLTAAETERAELKVALDAATNKAQQQRTTHDEIMKTERDIRFSETTILTKIVESLRTEISALKLENAELTSRLTFAMHLDEQNNVESQKKICTERRDRFNESATLTRMIEELRTQLDQIAKKKRPIESWLVSRFLGNERKQKKYNRDRETFFADSQSWVVRAYFHLRSGP